MPDLRVRVDEWVLPSHTQAARVAEGSLDLAIAWIEEADIERHNLAAHLLRYEHLEAVMPRAHPATRHDRVPASEITVLVDVDEASWLSWNRYASTFAEANQASATHRRWRHCRSRFLRPREPSAAPGARVAQAPFGSDAADVDTPASTIPGSAMGLGAPSPRNNRGRWSADPDSHRSRHDTRLANTSVRALLASIGREERLTRVRTRGC